MQTQVEITYHKTIDELPRNKFIDCDVDDNLASLIIGTVPDPETLINLWPSLQHAWLNIQSQYGERVGDNEYKMYVKLFKEIEILRITLTQINSLAARQKKDDLGNIIQPAGLLRLYYVEEKAKELNDLLKTSCRFNYLDPKSYHAELDKCINRSKAIKIQLDLKLLTFHAIQQKQQARSGEKNTRQYHASMLVTLSDFAKYHLAEDMKMGEYCERLNRFIQACEKSTK